MRSDFLEVAKSDMSGKKSGSCPDHSNKHTRTFNKLNLFVSVLHIQIVYFLAPFDGPIHCKCFTTMLQSHLYQCEQLTLTTIDYLIRLILKRAVSGYCKNQNSLLHPEYFVDLFVQLFVCFHIMTS